MRARTKHCKRRKLAPLIPLKQYYERYLCVCRATGDHLRRTDPKFPALYEVAVNRFAIREDDGAEYQALMRERALKPRPVPPQLRDAKAAAAKSAQVRSAKAEQRRAMPGITNEQEAPA
jgi:hypothetical protein